MKKIILTDDLINEIAASFKAIAPPEKFKEAKKFAKKCNFELTNDMHLNRQFAWTFIKAEMEALPFKDAFRYHYQQDLRIWQYRDTDPEITLAFIKYKKYDDGYNSLSASAWRSLDYSIHSLSTVYELNTDGLLTRLIETDGDIREFLNGYSKKNCPNDILKATELLQTTLDNLFKGLDCSERYRIAQAAQQYAAAENMCLIELHNILNGR